MSVIIRLQGLPWSASAMDIRNFFRGLIIPQGGVHIIGGERGDAFIAFSSDEDARQAMMRNTACINGSSCTLFLSSKSEMQTVIDEACNRDVPPAMAAGGAPPPAGRIMSPGLQQQHMGGPPGLENQPDPDGPDINIQRPGQQPQPGAMGGSYQKPPEHFPDRGYPHMQQMNPNMVPADSRVPNNQYGFPSDRRPMDPYQQNAPPHHQQQLPPGGKPKLPGGNDEGPPMQDPWAQEPGYEGFQPDGGMGKESQGPPHHHQQWNMGGGFGARGMEGGMGGGYDQQDAGQWGQQGFGGGQPGVSGQPGVGPNQPPAQGFWPGQQRDNATPSDSYMNPAGQQGPDAGGFPHHQQQQGGQPLWQEDYAAVNNNTNSRDPFPRNATEQDANNRRGGMVPPPRPGQPGFQSGVEGGEGGGPPLGGQQGPPEDHMRFPPGMGRPGMGMEQMQMGRGRDPPGVDPSQDPRFPPRRDGPPGRAWGLGEGIFPDGPPGKRGGILPTPDMAGPNQQLQQFGGEQIMGPEAGGKQGQWPQESGQEAWDFQRGPGGPGQFSRGREQEAMGGGRPFEAPDGHRSRDIPRRSRFDQADDRPNETGSDGRPIERGFEENPMEMDSDHREQDQDRGFNGRPFRRGPGGPVQDEWPGPDRRNLNRFGEESEGRPFDRGPGNRPAIRDVGGMAFDRGNIREDRDMDRRLFKRGPEGRPKEGGLLGRRPLPGAFEGPDDGQGPMDMDLDPNPEDPEEAGRRGPPGRHFPGAQEFDDGDRDKRSRFGRNGDRRFDERRGGRGGEHNGGRGRRPFDRESRFGSRYEEGRARDQGEDRHRDRFDRDGRESRVADRPMRGRDRLNQGRDMDRRSMRRDREDGGTMRGRREEFLPEEPARPVGRGLLGDAPAPGGLLPTPGRTLEEPLAMRAEDASRDGDRRGGREDRDMGREERPCRLLERRDRSPVRDSRRSEPDRSQHRHRPSRGTERFDRSDKKPDEAEGKHIHATGFPATYTTMEIQRFFMGCDLLFTGINIVKNAQRQSTGEVFLEFPSTQSAKKAMSKNGETIFGSPVTLKLITKQEFVEKLKSPPSGSVKEKPAVAAPVEDDKGSHIVKISGLPPNIKSQDLINFFSSVKLGNSGKSVVIEVDDKQQPTGVAYLVAASRKDFDSAMSYNGHMFGNKSLQLCTAEEKELEACIAAREKATISVDQLQEKTPAGPGVMGARPSLMGVAPPRRPAPFGPGPDGLRNGPAFEPPPNTFPRPPGPGIRPPPPGPGGNRQPPPPVEGLPRSFGPGDGLPRSFGPRRFGPRDNPAKGPGDRPAKGPGDRPAKGPGFCVRLQGLSMSVTYNEIREFFHGLKIIPRRGVQIVHDGNEKPTGEGFVEFESQEDKDEGLKRDKTSLGDQIVAVKSVSKADMIERLRKARMSGIPPEPPHFDGPPRRRGGGGDVPPPPPGIDIPHHLLNPRWFYVSCQNFPPGITVPEILEFFQEFNPVPDSVRQLYADDGTSTGNAVVAFFNRLDAEMVLEEMNGAVYGHSMVILHPIILG